MRKAYKRLLTVAISLCAAGILAFVIGMSVLGWDFYRLDTAEYSAKSYVPDAAVTSFELNVESFPVTVKRGDSVSLDYFEASDSEVSVATENGVLKVRERRKRKMFNMFNLGRSKHKYVLTVADGSEINISGTSISVFFDGLETPALTITSVNVDIDFKACNIGTLEIKATNLDADLYDCEIDEIRALDGVNGEVNVNSCSGRALSLEFTNLDAHITSAKFDTMTFDGTNTDVTADTVTAISVTVDGTNTDAELVRITADDIDLSGVNLDAELYVMGRAADYGIYSDGRGLPQSRPGATDKRITLSGVNNDVELRFAEQ